MTKKDEKRYPRISSDVCLYSVFIVFWKGFGKLLVPSLFYYVL